MVIFIYNLFIFVQTIFQKKKEMKHLLTAKI